MSQSGHTEFLEQYPGEQCEALRNTGLRRGRMKIGSAEPFEDKTVLWLQAGRWFADIRICNRSDGEHEGFAGLIDWQNPFLRFHHLVNISGTLSSDDIGTIEFTDFGCYERGTFTHENEQIPFEEKWLADLRSNRALVYARADTTGIGALEVQHDKLCIVVTRRAAACYARQHDIWQCLYHTRTGSVPLPHEKTVRKGWRLIEETT